MFATIILIIMQCFILVVFLSSCTTPKHLGHTKRNRPENRCRQKASLKKKKRGFFLKDSYHREKKKKCPQKLIEGYLFLFYHMCVSTFQLVLYVQSVTSKIENNHAKDITSRKNDLII